MRDFVKGTQTIILKHDFTLWKLRQCEISDTDDLNEEPTRVQVQQGVPAGALPGGATQGDEQS